MATLSPCSADTGISTTSSVAQPSELVSSLNSAEICGEDLGRVLDEVDLVHGEHQLRDTEQRENRCVPASLRDDALAGVDQQDHELRRRGTRDRVAGVLHVTRSIGKHEGALGGREIAVRHVDGDALLALGAQTVDQQRQVRGGQTPVHRRPGDGVDLVGENGFRVVQQTADEGGLAVVDTAGGGQSQQVAHDQK